MASDASHNVQAPRLEELMSGFLRRQAAARAAGLAELPLGEVEPYEAAFAPVVEPRVAWNDALSALKLLDRENGKIEFNAPADWSSLVAANDSVAAVTYAAGHFPQLLRDLPALIEAPRRPNPDKSAEPVSVPSLITWTTEAAARGRWPQVLFGIGALRLARQLDTAARLLEDIRARIPQRWQDALANEEAALAWRRGQSERAVQLWNDLPDSAPAWFNRGLAALFLDRPAEARAALAKAVALLPDESAWHHLARLYLALAEI
jgi:tetratricopeptide (TPR) repeat protein